jgi:hypothetical protein
MITISLRSLLVYLNQSFESFAGSIYELPLLDNCSITNRFLAFHGLGTVCRLRRHYALDSCNLMFAFPSSTTAKSRVEVTRYYKANRSTILQVTRPNARQLSSDPLGFERLGCLNDLTVLPEITIQTCHLQLKLNFQPRIYDNDRHRRDLDPSCQTRFGIKMALLENGMSESERVLSLYFRRHTLLSFPPWSYGKPSKLWLLMLLHAWDIHTTNA